MAERTKRIPAGADADRALPGRALGQRRGRKGEEGGGGRGGLGFPLDRLVGVTREGALDYTEILTRFHQECFMG
jgi:hypothetical protein